MNRQMLTSTVLALAVMAGTACLLGRVQSHQKLGEPGVKTHPLPGSIRLEAELPERVLDFDSKPLDNEDVVLAVLPKDTSFGQRRYEAPDGFRLDLRVVLMGHDRTSLHRPQFCLTGQGWRIDETASSSGLLKVERPISYDLPVVELVAHRAFEVDGQSHVFSGIYVYWYVADDALSAGTLGIGRMWSMASKLLRTGVLQRWSYVSCFAACQPGQEAATYDRMKRFIVAAVPEFQLYPRPQVGKLTAAAP
jgi:hypothetical protein